MNIFKARTLAWWEVSILKLSLLSLGIAIGAYWSSFFTPLVGVLVGIGAILGAVSVLLWFRKTQ